LAYNFARYLLNNRNFMLQSLPIDLYTAEQVRELDRIAIQGHAIPGIKLMKRAGRAVFDEINWRWPGSPVTVFCGAGNNGGDGYIVAALAAEHQLPVQLIHLSPPDRLTGDARTAYEYALSVGVLMASFTDCLELQVGVIVDAMLGTGLIAAGSGGQVREPYAQAIRLVNHSGLPIVAVDVPSGLCSNTGTVAGVAVEANLTVTFIGLKQGLFTAKGPALSGEIVYNNLSVPSDIFYGIQPSAFRLQCEDLLENLSFRHRDAHKGDFGHVMVIGGDTGFGGAVAMAGEAALRTGAGLVSVITQPEHVTSILTRRPELMVKGISSGQELASLLDGRNPMPTVLVIGPGLGQSPWSEQMLQQVLALELPVVLDADALNILSEGRLVAPPDRTKWVITPHPGEAARLLGMTTSEVQADRFSAVRLLQKKFNCSALLKGAGSLVCSPFGGTATNNVIGLCDAGTPGMATAGMGDVLSGIVGGLLAQGLSSDVALSLGVCLHAQAGEMAADGDDRGVLATDLFPSLRLLINGCVGE
jgi:NAD(P)H-hydrate epimerase